MTSDLRDTIIDVTPHYIQYEYNNNVLTMLSVFDEYEIGLTFSHGGANDLFSIRDITMRDTDHTASMIAVTDWIGPYKVRAAYGDTESEPIFTGGWHSYADGSISASTTEFRIYADDTELVSPNSGQAKKIIIEVTNLIKAYNSDTYVIEEKVTYLIFLNQIYVTVTSTALDDIIIEQYYGLQTHNLAWNKYIEYNYNDSTSTTRELNSASDSILKTESKTIKSFVLSSTKNDFLLKAWIAGNTDLTRFKYLADGLPYAFTTDYGKSYFNLVNGIPLHLETGEFMEWTGGYVLKKNIHKKTLCR